MAAAILEVLCHNPGLGPWQKSLPLKLALEDFRDDVECIQDGHLYILVVVCLFIQKGLISDLGYPRQVRDQEASPLGGDPTCGRGDMLKSY